MRRISKPELYDKTDRELDGLPRNSRRQSARPRKTLAKLTRSCRISATSAVEIGDPSRSTMRIFKSAGPNLTLRQIDH